MGYLRLVDQHLLKQLLFPAFRSASLALALFFGLSSHWASHCLIIMSRGRQRNSDTPFFGVALVVNIPNILELENRYVLIIHSWKTFDPDNRSAGFEDVPVI